MVKKASSKKKKSVRKKTTRKKSSSTLNIEKALVENFVALQKVMTHTATKLDKLSDEISKLLKLFEDSAKSLAEKDFDVGKEKKDVQEIKGKVDNLLEQNKIIAKGLTLLHDKEGIQHQQGGQPSQSPQNTFQKQTTDIGRNMSDYQKSISFRNNRG